MARQSEQPTSHTTLPATSHAGRAASMKRRTKSLWWDTTAATPLLGQGLVRGWIRSAIRIRLRVLYQMARQTLALCNMPNRLDCLRLLRQGGIVFQPPAMLARASRSFKGFAKPHASHITSERASNFA